ncbi:hypothetical protein BO85DRAFT_485517 [Aspergillus piperis CBS 112811]|uniref:Uncharacterized protein n=1 Tax=Aspergillus piperis CBS 112811 TaxID=1448313 RepID=A0A8G1R8W2_9EURO|nr:hypothetical protein BO85DRAFT_485517 [Aspergillus piperis CBS 112811]RAH60374.1 hypothetical protein BO85DRAFT_485517 [Aspergillus piperis CBS 112811]
MYWPTSQNEKWFCGILFVQGLLVIVLNIYNLVQWQSWVNPNATQVPISYQVPINIALIMFAVVYEIFLGLDMVHHKNIILLLALCISNGCVLAYSVMQYISIHMTTLTIGEDRDSKNQPLVDLSRDLWKEIQPAELLVPITVGIATLLMWPIAYWVHREFSWAIYQYVQGSLQSRKQYRGYEAYLVLIKFDFFFLVGFIIQYDLIGVHFKEPEYSLTLALIPAALLVMTMGTYFVRREYRVPTAIIAVCRLGIAAYLLSRIIVLCGKSLRARTPGKDMMLLFGIVAFVLSCLIIVCTIYCILNFEHGLKSVFARKEQVSRRSFVFQELPSHTNSTRQSRLSLD